MRELKPVTRQVVHALELAGEDCERWCGGLSEAELHARPFGLPSVGFQMRHLVRSLDRLLTYAEGNGLSEAQMQLLRGEQEFVGREELFREFAAGLAGATERVKRLEAARFAEARFVGRDRLETTLGGLVVHCAEHTQRHAGQMVTTAKVVIGSRQQGAANL